MMRPMARSALVALIATLAAATLAALVAGGCARKSGPPSVARPETVAMTGDRPVTLDAFMAWVKTATSEDPKNVSPRVLSSLLDQYLDEVLLARAVETAEPPVAGATPREKRRAFLNRAAGLEMLQDSDLRKEYDAHPERYGSPAPPDAERDHKRTGYHETPDGQTAATVHAPTKIDNDLYVRDYSKCILCYKCVDACGEQYQNTFAITVAGRGFDARISTEYANPLPESACVYCGNCIAVCPTGALMFSSEHELRKDAAWDESRQTQTETICPYCGVGCNLTLHVQDNQIVKVSSPDDHDITRGNLCIKGRFGFQHISPKRDSTSTE